MSFIARCLYCNHKMQAPPNAVGRSVRCPKCNNQFTVFPSDEKPAQASTVTAAALTAPPLALGPMPAEPMATSPVTTAQIIAERPTAPASVKTVTVVQTATPSSFAEVRRPLLKRPGAQAGVVALLLGSFGLALASVPGFAVFTMPLCAIGCVAGLVGVVLVLDQTPTWTGLGVPALGIATSAAVLIVAFVFPPLLGPTYNQWRHGASDDPRALQLIPINIADARKLRLEENGWADASRAAVQQDQLRVQLISAAVEPIELRPENPKVTGKKYVAIRLRLQQVGSQRGLEFHHWGPHSPSPEKASPVLTDQSGKAYAPLTFDDGTLIRGQTLSAPLYANAVVHDLVVFDVPPARAVSYKLTLPAHAWGGVGEFKFVIPANFVKR